MKIAKGVLSAIDVANNRAEVGLSELGNAVTSFIPFLTPSAAMAADIGDNVVVLIFSNSFSDAVILPKKSSSAGVITLATGDKKTQEDFNLAVVEAFKKLGVSLE